MHSLVPHRGRMLQRGNGLGGLFRSLSRTLVPLATKAFTSKAAKTVGRVARDEAIRLGTSAAADALAGDNVGQALEKHAAAARRRAAGHLRRAGEAAASRPPPAAPKRAKRSGKRGGGKKGRRGKPLF